MRSWNPTGAELSGLSNLTRLEMYSCNLLQLPTAVVLECDKLIHLDIGNNSIFDMPAAPYIGAHILAPPPLGTTPILFGI